MRLRLNPRVPRCPKGERWKMWRASFLGLLHLHYLASKSNSVQSTRGVHANKLESHKNASHKASVLMAAEHPRQSEEISCCPKPQQVKLQVAASLNKNMFTVLLCKQTNKQTKHKTEGEGFWRSAWPLHLFHFWYFLMQGHHRCPWLWNCIAL